MERGAAVAASMATATGPLPARRAGSAAHVTPEGGVAWDGSGTIVYAGPASGLPWAPTVGAIERGCLVPGFVDAHVHLPFVGWRADEFEARLRGVSYAELHGEVCRFAKALKSLGVGLGDRVVIYMPLIPEAVIAMYACARIGAVHSVVFGGFSANAVKDRIEDAGAKLVITADGGWRGGHPVELKRAVEKALADGCRTVQNVIV